MVVNVNKNAVSKFYYYKIGLYLHVHPELYLSRWRLIRKCCSVRLHKVNMAYGYQRCIN